MIEVFHRLYTSMSHGDPNQYRGRATVGVWQIYHIKANNAPMVHAREHANHDSGVLMQWTLRPLLLLALPWCGLVPIHMANSESFVRVVCGVLRTLLHAIDGIRPLQVDKQQPPDGSSIFPSQDPGIKIIRSS